MADSNARSHSRNGQGDLLSDGSIFIKSLRSQLGDNAVEDAGNMWEPGLHDSIEASAERNIPGT